MKGIEFVSIEYIMYQRNQQFCDVVNNVIPKTTTIDAKGGLEMKTSISYRGADHKSGAGFCGSDGICRGKILAAIQMWKKRIAPNLKSSARGKLTLAMPQMSPFRFET